MTTPFGQTIGTQFASIIDGKVEVRVATWPQGVELLLKSDEGYSSSRDLDGNIVYFEDVDKAKEAFADYYSPTRVCLGCGRKVFVYPAGEQACPQCDRVEDADTYVHDSELPGMWEQSDFLGGRED